MCLRSCLCVQTSWFAWSVSKQILLLVDVDLLLFFFFFQAEDGIRDLTVTGVQTCALPISKQGAAAIPQIAADEVKAYCVRLTPFMLVWLKTLNASPMSWRRSRSVN